MLGDLRNENLAISQSNRKVQIFFVLEKVVTKQLPDMLLKQNICHVPVSPQF